MKLPALLSRMLSPFVRKGEGDYHPGPWWLPITGGWLPAGVGDSMNWWQNGYDPLYAPRSAMVEACVSAYAQTVAMCPGDHWRANTKGGRDRVKTSSLARVLRHPNDYQSISDFLLNLVRSLYLDGNAYALALRNDRYEIDELHLMRPELSYPRVATTGDVFYQLYGNDVIDRRLGVAAQPLLVPARDVLHVRMNVNRRFPTPLVGESPVVAAYADIGVGTAIAAQQAAFYANEARPSAVLSTDLVLDKDQVQALRDRWNEQAKGLKQGGTPILTAGLKVMPWTIGGRDAATADILKLSNEHIALAFRIPLQIFGLGGNTFSSTEALMQYWISTGLGFALNHVEEAFGLLFMLRGQPDEYVEFDTAALLRSALKDRIEALARGVQGGIYAPNEARNSEGLDSVEYGDEPRVQQQVVPLSAAGQIPPPSPGPPAAPPAPADGGTTPPPDENKVSHDNIQREMRRLLASAARIGRSRMSA